MPFLRPFLIWSCQRFCLVWSRTLSVLGEDKLPDELVCRLGVKRQGVVQRLQVRAFLQEGFLQPHAASVEVLLCRERQGWASAAERRHSGQWQNKGFVSLLPPCDCEMVYLLLTNKCKYFLSYIRSKNFPWLKPDIRNYYSKFSLHFCSHNLTWFSE